MADRWDVTGRLAEGLQAVEHTQRYVTACALLGYENAELTTHLAQMFDWYGAQNGLDLTVLDADCARLDAAATAASDTAADVRAQLAVLADAWTGQGADAASAFLRMHCAAADTLAGALASAAGTLTALRDSLWAAVDTKVTAVIEIDDRHAADRAGWLASADTVITGVGDRPTASELIDLFVKPYVDNDIRNEWLTAMHTASEAVTLAYTSAVEQLNAAEVPAFEIPTGLAPRWVDAAPAAAPTPTVSAPTVSSPQAIDPAPQSVAAPSSEFAPTATDSVPAVTPASAQSVPAAATSLPAAEPVSAAVPETAQMGSSGTGLGDLLGGFADSLAGLLGSGSNLGTGSDLGAGSDVPGLLGSDAGVVQPPDLSETPVVEEELVPDEDLEEPEEDQPEDCAPDDETDAEPTETEPEPELESEPELGSEPVPTPVPVAPEIAPDPPQEPAPSPQSEPLDTPCEIPADELPHVGEP